MNFRIKRTTTEDLFGVTSIPSLDLYLNAENLLAAGHDNHNENAIIRKQLRWVNDILCHFNSPPAHLIELAVLEDPRYWKPSNSNQSAKGRFVSAVCLNEKLDWNWLKAWDNAIGHLGDDKIVCHPETYRNEFLSSDFLETNHSAKDKGFVTVSEGGFATSTYRKSYPFEFRTSPDAPYEMIVKVMKVFYQTLGQIVGSTGGTDVLRNARLYLVPFAGEGSITKLPDRQDTPLWNSFESPPRGCLFVLADRVSKEERQLQQAWKLVLERLVLKQASSEFDHRSRELDATSACTHALKTQLSLTQYALKQSFLALDENRLEDVRKELQTTKMLVDKLVALSRFTTHAFKVLASNAAPLQLQTMTTSTEVVKVVQNQIDESIRYAQLTWKSFPLSEPPIVVATLDAIEWVVFDKEQLAIAVEEVILNLRHAHYTCITDLGVALRSLDVDGIRYVVLTTRNTIKITGFDVIDNYAKPIEKSPGMHSLRVVSSAVGLPHPLVCSDGQTLTLTVFLARENAHQGEK